jgi:hypothetical protein
MDRFSVETYGGMAPDAIKLLTAMGDMGEERLGMWPRQAVIQHLVGSVATAVQRGTAVAWLSGCSRALAMMAQRRTTAGERRFCNSLGGIESEELEACEV